jgi:hypothetical protein
MVSILLWMDIVRYLNFEEGRQIPYGQVAAVICKTVIIP